MALPKAPNTTTGMPVLTAFSDSGAPMPAEIGPMISASTFFVSRSSTSATCLAACQLASTKMNSPTPLCSEASYFISWIICTIHVLPTPPKETPMRHGGAFLNWSGLVSSFDVGVIKPFGSSSTSAARAGPARRKAADSVPTSNAASSVRFKMMTPRWGA